MPCKACKSDNLQRLDGELTMSRPDPKELKVPPVYVCQSVLACFDCGFTELVIPVKDLRLLKAGKPDVRS